VTSQVAAAESILLDTTVFYHFAGAGCMSHLKAYLGGRARVTQEVRREIWVAQDCGYLQDATLTAMPLWPKKTGHIPEAFQMDFLRLRELAQEEEAHLRGLPDVVKAERHSGEVSTVLMAQCRHDDLVVIDDGYGRKLALRRDLTCLKTAELVVQLAREGALTENDALRSYNQAASTTLGISQFRALLMR